MNGKNNYESDETRLGYLMQMALRHDDIGAEVSEEGRNEELMENSEP